MSLHLTNIEQRASVRVRSDLVASDPVVVHLVLPPVGRLFHAVLQAILELQLREIDTFDIGLILQVLAGCVFGLVLQVRAR